MDSIQSCKLFDTTKFSKSFKNEILSVEWKDKTSVINERRKRRNDIKKLVQENPTFEPMKIKTQVAFTCLYNIDTQELKIKFDTYETKTTN